METQDLARWMEEEHDALRALAANLQTKIAAPPRSKIEQWLADVRASFSEYTEHARKHMALEESGGYLSEVLSRRPTLSNTVKELGHEHRAFSQLMTQISSAMEGIRAEDQLLIRDACTRIKILLSYIDRHEERENHLVLCTFTEDIGTQD
jgi:hemerythrin-like domain-containing protein